MFKYSIIIPIYNVEQYITKCIESVLNQTYTNYEIILVDDGSKDNSGNICDDFAKNNDFIKVIHKKNGGLSDARNVGLENSVGDYVIFLDSDDFWIDCHFLENISKLEGDIDLIIFNSFKCYDNDYQRRPRFQIDKDFQKFDNIKKREYVVQNNIYKACAWDKVIKREILFDNSIFFPLNMLSEDMIWAGNLLMNVKNIQVYDEVVYAYRQRNNSISKKVNQKHLDDIYKQISTGIKNENELIYTYYAYEYCILYMYSYISKDKVFFKNVKELRWLLKHNECKKVKVIYLLDKVLGFSFTRYILFHYIEKKDRRLR